MIVTTRYGDFSLSKSGRAARMVSSDRCGRNDMPHPGNSGTKKLYGLPVPFIAHMVPPHLERDIGDDPISTAWKAVVLTNVDESRMFSCPGGSRTHDLFRVKEARCPPALRDNSV